MARRTNKSKKWLVACVLIAFVIVGLAFLRLDENTVYFFTPDEAVAKAQNLAAKKIRIGAMVLSGSIKWDPQTLDLQFDISDLGTNQIHVQYKGTPPDMFKENSGVIVEGRLDPSGKTFAATTLMVKHSEEYKAPDTKHSLDKTLLEKSIFKS